MNRLIKTCQKNTGNDCFAVIQQLVEGRWNKNDSTPKRQPRDAQEKQGGF